MQEKCERCAAVSSVKNLLIPVDISVMQYTGENGIPDPRNETVILCHSCISAIINSLITSVPCIRRLSLLHELGLDIEKE